MRTLEARLHARPEDHTRDLRREILLDHANEWWVPKSSNHDVFERALMKFLNGNLNYFDFQNMLHHAVDKNPKRNPAFKKMYDFCEYTRTLTGHQGTFGRMNVWCVPPGMFIKPHRDMFTYHYNITRWIYFLNLGVEDTEVKVGGIDFKVSAGDFFEFYPAEQYHAFKNNAEVPWFFVAFDTWDQDALLSNLRTLEPDYENSPLRRRYMSDH